MAALKDKVQNALDETRMLILGAQVLLGFQFQSALQPAFERLPAFAQYLEVAGLGLMVVAVGLLVSPGAFHQIAERGEDSPRILSFTNRVAASALLPIALGMGIDIYVATLLVLGSETAIPIAAAATAFALFWWYGLQWIWHERRPAHAHMPPREEHTVAEQNRTSLDDKIRQVLTEGRVALPGAQALLGFQFAAILMDAFAKLPWQLQYIHLSSLGLIAMSVVFLIAPAAFHRIVEDGEDTARMHRFSSAMLVCAMVPLALGIAGDFYVVADKVLGSDGLAQALALASLVFFYGLWFGLTVLVRARVQRPKRADLDVRQTPRAA